MTPHDIIRNYINGLLLNGNEVGNDDELMLSGRLDSLNIVKLFAFLEDEFGAPISVADVTVETMRSVNNIASYLEKVQS